jgi:hypothetical protein
VPPFVAAQFQERTQVASLQVSSSPLMPQHRNVTRLSFRVQ